MLLNYEQIKTRKIITNPSESNFGNGSYTVKIGTLLSVDGKEHDSYSIEPQGMVVVISSESFDLADNIIGNATIKNSISNSGILAINIGIVDPGYKGRLSSVLINFGRTKFDIKSGTDFIRMTFHEFEKPVKPIPVIDGLNVSDSRYIKQKKEEARGYLDETFLSLNRVEDKIKKSIIVSMLKYVSAISLIIALVAFSFKTYFDIQNNNSKTNEEKFKIMEDKIDNNKQNLDDIRKQNLDIKSELEKMKNVKPNQPTKKS